MNLTVFDSNSLRNKLESESKLKEDLPVLKFSLDLAKPGVN